MESKRIRGCVCSNNTIICQTVKIEDGPLSITPEVKANAKLIASAPELLEACKKALIWGTEVGIPTSVLRQAGQAISKAEEK